MGGHCWEGPAAARPHVARATSLHRPWCTRFSVACRPPIRPPTPSRCYRTQPQVAGNPAKVIKQLRQGERGGDQAAGVEAAPPHKRAAVEGEGGKPAAGGTS